MQKLDTAIVPLFKDPHIVDITFPYTKDFKKELHIPKYALYKGNPHSRIAYLCASKRMDWDACRPGYAGSSAFGGWEKGKYCR